MERSHKNRKGIILVMEREDLRRGLEGGVSAGGEGG